MAQQVQLQEIADEYRPVLGLGDEVPNFTAKTQKGSLTFHDYITGS